MPLRRPGERSPGFLRHISVSVDGPGALHDAARGVRGTFERTAAGLRRLQAAAARRSAPLRLSINTTVAAETLGSLHLMADVAREFGVDAIGLNHLMFATPEEAEQTAKIVGAPDGSAIATFVTPDPGLASADVARQVQRLQGLCREKGLFFDFRPRVWPSIVQHYYTPGAPLLGRCLYPFLHARVGFSGKVYFCPFIRIEVGDLSTSTIEDVCPRYVGCAGSCWASSSSMPALLQGRAVKGPRAGPRRSRRAAGRSAATIR